MTMIAHKVTTPDITQYARALSYDTKSVTWRMFDPSTGRLRPKYVRRARILAAKRWLRTWRPRFRVHVVLFPKTQRRLAAMELKLDREHGRVLGLESRINRLEGKYD